MVWDEYFNGTHAPLASSRIFKNMSLTRVSIYSHDLCSSRNHFSSSRIPRWYAVIRRANDEKECRRK